MRIIFMGTPDFAVPALVALHEAGHEIACVYSQPPSRSGRGKKLRPSPVHAKAQELGIEVRTPKSLKSAEEREAFAALNADVAVVAAYGLILKQAVLDAPKHGCINIHASILPRWRGAAPIHRAIMAGDSETGVTIMQMEAGLDTGPMLHVVTTPIAKKTTGELMVELARLGAEAMVEVLGDLSAYPPQEQDDALACYAPKIDKAEARLDFTRPAYDLIHQIQGLAPFPGAWFEVDGERVKVLEASAYRQGHGEPGEVLEDNFLDVGTGSLDICLRLVQPAGKQAMLSSDYLRGRPIAPGTVLT